MAVLRRLPACSRRAAGSGKEVAQARKTATGRGASTSGAKASGRSATYERELQRARELALSEMQERAAELGGNAAVGVDLDYEVIGQGGSMLMVSASGTAVVVE